MTTSRNTFASRPHAVFALALVLVSSGATLARADAREEAPDPTRLDVERLPPEAIQVTRDMYARGFFVIADLGGRGMAGGAGRLAQPGPLARVSFGYEALSWLGVGLQLGMSFHATDAPPPPAATAFQLYTLLLQPKFQIPLSVRAALWLSPELGIGWASGDFLQAWGLLDAGRVTMAYGGELGFDWHLFNAHHSLGLATGALLEPNLDRSASDHATVLHASAYLKYVF